MNLKEQNILFLTRGMGQGGTENIIIQLCEIFQPLVNNIIVCSCGGILVDKLRMMGINHYTIPDIANKNPVNIIKCCLTIMSIIKNEKITVVHSHHRMAACYAELVASKNIIKLANAHNTFHDKKKLTQFAYCNTKIIAVGEMVKKNLTEYFNIPNSQISVIYNGVKAFDHHTNPIDVLQSERVNGKILIGNIGRLSEQKGMSYFLEAAAITVKVHPEAYFVIVGDGELKEKLKEKAKDLKLDNKVLFLGYRNDIQNVIQQLDFVVLSSLWEGLPLTPIEAFSVGKPVIGTAVDGTKEIIHDGENGYLIPPCDAIQLAKKINYLIENPEDRKTMGNLAIKYYLNVFSFDNFRQKYIKFYKEL